MPGQASDNRSAHMPNLPIDIDLLPQLDTAVGLFGSIQAEYLYPSLHEVVVTVLLIIID